ncbi:MAG: hypothetical protein AMXMBFR55_13720 [Gemmatimonadota bacterium]
MIARPSLISVLFASSMVTANGADAVVRPTKNESAPGVMRSEAIGVGGMLSVHAAPATAATAKARRASRREARATAGEDRSESVVCIRSDEVMTPRDSGGASRSGAELRHPGIDAPRNPRIIAAPLSAMMPRGGRL